MWTRVSKIVILVVKVFQGSNVDQSAKCCNFYGHAVKE